MMGSDDKTAYAVLACTPLAKEKKFQCFLNRGRESDSTAALPGLGASWAWCTDTPTQTRRLGSRYASRITQEDGHN